MFFVHVYQNKILCFLHKSYLSEGFDFLNHFVTFHFLDLTASIGIFCCVTFPFLGLTTSFILSGYMLPFIFLNWLHQSLYLVACYLSFSSPLTASIVISCCLLSFLSISFDCINCYISLLVIFPFHLLFPLSPVT